MVYSLGYRRPSYHSSTNGSISGEEKQNSITESINSGTSGMSHGIPEALSFDKIIAGATCPPCTVRDFMNYLQFIEHSAENLQFFLWLRDYTERFETAPSREKVLSPEWTVGQAEAEALAAQSQARPGHKVGPETSEMFKGTDFEAQPKIPGAIRGNPFYTPPRTPSTDSKHGSDSSINRSEITSKSTHQRKTEAAFEEAGMKWQPFSMQPFREEIERIISTYIADGAPRQLNLSARERTALLHALENTTHPSAFRSVRTTVEWSLRCQAHPNFIRWTICNGNRPRVIFARGLGIAGILAGIITGILITLSSAGRAWRVMSFIGFMIGISTLIAAWKGMCVVLHGLHHRHLRPWELFAEADDASVVEVKNHNDSMDSFASSNSYEDQPWVAKYEKRNVIRKVFDREVIIQEPALRQIQDTIFLQAILGAFVLSAVATGIFCAVPKGNFY